ncbi:zinc ribbon domain-containing protein [Lachnospiraceae bacterium 62-35]
MKCRQCGTEMEDDSVFCPNCGAKSQQDSQDQSTSGSQDMIFCPNCGQQMTADSAFCPNCGQTVEGSGRAGKKDLKKILVPVGAAAAAIIVIAAAVGIGGKLFGSSGGSGKDKIYNKDKLIYAKDDSLYFANLNKLKKEPVEYTDDIRDSDMTYGFSGVLSGSYRGASFTRDGKYCYYPERMDEDGRFRLMCKKVGSKDEGEKIDSDVIAYNIAASGDVIYQKDNYSLYLWDGKEKNKVDSDVARTSFNVSEDGSAVIWTKDEGDFFDLYYQKFGKKSEKIKLESDVEDLLGFNEDYSKIYIMKNDTVYQIVKQGKKEKVVGDAYSVRGLDPDKGTFFYLVESEAVMVAEDFVTDDIGQDENNSRWDGLREDLKEREIHLNLKDLYYFDGKEKQLVSDSAAGVETSRKGVAIFKEAGSEDIPRINLSEINYAGDVEDHVREYQSSVYCLAVGPEVTELDEEPFRNYKWDEDKGFIYALKGEDEDGNDLLSINIGKGNQGEITTVDEDVEYLEGVYNGSLYYFKDLDRYGYAGDLYRDGEMVVSDAAINSVVEIPESSGVLCITDGNSDKNRGTLTLVKGKKTNNIADDVSYFDAVGEKAVIMLTDYNSSRRRGDLKYFQGKEVKTIDTDVSGFYSIGNSGGCP